MTSLTLATVFISSICAEEKALNTVCAKFKGCLPVIDLKQLTNIAHILKLKYKKYQNFELFSDIVIFFHIINIREFIMYQA